MAHPLHTHASTAFQYNCRISVSTLWRDADDKEVSCLLGRTFETSLEEKKRMYWWAVFDGRNASKSVGFAMWSWGEGENKNPYSCWVNLPVFPISDKFQPGSSLLYFHHLSLVLIESICRLSVWYAYGTHATQFSLQFPLLRVTFTECLYVTTVIQKVISMLLLIENCLRYGGPRN
jgi:hypothetical protein